MGFEHVIPQITKKFYENRKLIENKKTIKLEIQGGGKTSRSFIFIDDSMIGSTYSDLRKILTVSTGLFIDSRSG